MIRAGLTVKMVDDAARARALHPAIARLAQRWGVDLALTGAESKRPRRRLIAFDMDSTLIRCEVIDQLAARAGVGEAVAAITALSSVGSTLVTTFESVASALQEANGGS